MNHPYGFCTFVRQDDIDFVGDDVLGVPFYLTPLRETIIEESLSTSFGSKSFNHFAAEIRWHADRLQTETLGSDDYHSCLKADLGVETSAIKQQGEYLEFTPYLSGQTEKHSSR